MAIRLRLKSMPRLDAPSWYSVGLTGTTKAMAKTSRVSRQIFQCPVCYEPLVTPVHQCEEGHLLCVECIGQVSCCPICRQKLPEKRIRNRAVEEIIEEQLEPCPHRHRGCLVRLKNEEDLAEHQFECPYALMCVCSTLETRSLNNCEQKLPIKSFSDHLEGDHRWQIQFPKVILGQDCVFTISLPRSLEQVRALRPASPNWLIFKVDDKASVFLLKIKHVEGRTYLVPYIVGNKRKSKLYFCNIQVSGENNLPTITWKGPVLSVRAKLEDERLTCSITEECLGSLTRRARTGEDCLAITISFNRKEVPHQT